MSKYEQRDNSGSLFKNEEKESERHPDYSGMCVINGVEMYMDAWLKTADSGRRWMSFSFKAKGKSKDSKPEKQQPSRRQRDEDSDVPF